MNNKILIVDDEKMLTQLLSAHLSNEGYLVYTSNSASEAMENLKMQPDIILLDIFYQSVYCWQLYLLHLRHFCRCF